MILYSSGTIYTYVEIKNGKIIRIGDERGRDGGWYWDRNWDFKTLQTEMSDLAKEWPKFYEDVRKRVDDKLLPLSVVKRNHLKKEIRRAEKDVARIQGDLTRAKHKLLKLMRKDV